MKTIETERLIMHLSNINDAEFFLELYNSPKFIEFIGDRNLRTKEDAENYIRERFIPHIEAHGFGNYTVQLKENGMKIGAVGIFKREGLEIPDIGFSFLDAYIGKGYAYESAKKLLEVAQSHFGLAKVSAMTTDSNIASQKLIKRLGLSFKGYEKIPGDAENLRYYKL